MSKLLRTIGVAFAIGSLGWATHADARIIHLFGGINSDAGSSVDFLGEALITLQGTTTTAMGDGFFYDIDVPEGEQTLVVTGGPCALPTPNLVDATGDPDSILGPDFQHENLILQGIVPSDGSVHYRCDSWNSFGAPSISEQLKKKVSVSPTKAGVITFNKAVKFGGKLYRKAYVTGTGWLSFNPVTLSNVPPCDQITASNAPANSLFPFASCAATKSVQWDVDPLRVRWHLVDPSTGRATDVELAFGHPRFDGFIGVIYGALDDGDGSSAFVGLTTASGGVLPIGDHEASLLPNSPMQITTTP